MGEVDGPWFKGMLPDSKSVKSGRDMDGFEKIVHREQM